MAYTKEEKKAYFKKLQQNWAEAKKLSETDEVQAIVQEIKKLGITVSQNSLAFIWEQLKEQKLGGIPVVDTKTFGGWKKCGMRVKKGETSTLKGITWMSVDGDKKEDKEGKKEEKGYSYPKVYRLFHSSQVEKI